jgi:hypothetical protein
MGLWPMPKWPPCKRKPELPDLALVLVACVRFGLANPALVMESLTGLATI